MQRIEIAHIRFGFLRLVARLGVELKQFQMILVEVIDQVFVRVFINDDELTRHNLEGRHRFHIVCVVVVAPDGLVAFFLIQTIESRRVGNNQEVGVVLGRHHRVCNFLNAFKKFDTNGRSSNFGELVPHNQQSVIKSLLFQFVFNLFNPFAEVLAVDAHIKTVFSPCPVLLRHNLQGQT